MSKLMRHFVFLFGNTPISANISTGASMQYAQRINLLMSWRCKIGNKLGYYNGSLIFSHISTQTAVNRHE